MKILADENVPRLTVNHMRTLGHDVRDVRGTGEQGIEDLVLWNVARAEGRMLIATDRGFTEYPSSSHNGILIVRLRQPNRLKIHRAVLLAMERFPATESPGLLVVVRDAVLSVSRAGGPVERL